MMQPKFSATKLLPKMTKMSTFLKDCNIFDVKVQIKMIDETFFSFNYSDQKKTIRKIQF